MQRYDWLSGRIDRGKSICKQAGGSLEFALRAPVTELALSECESEMRQRLPDSFRAFLQLSDGASFNWSGRNRQGMIKILSAADVLSENRQFRAIFDPEFERGEARARWGFLVPVVDYYDGNFLVAEPEIETAGDAAILYANHEESPQSWRNFYWIAATFELLLMRMFDEIGYSGLTADYWSFREPADSRRRLWRRVNES